MMGRLGRCALIVGALALYPVSARAQNTSFGTSVHLLVGQAAVQSTPATTAEQRYYDAPVVANRSYCAEATPSDTELNPAVPALTVFRSNQSSVLGTESGSAEPKGLAASRVCFVAPATETVFIQLATSADGRQYSLRFVETTLWTNWFFVGGDYNSYTLVRNTTNQAITVNYRWRDNNGAQVAALLNQPLPANGIAFINARQNGVMNCDFPAACPTITGSVDIAHNGSPEAIVGSQTTLSGGTGLSFDTLLFQRRSW